MLHLFCFGSNTRKSSPYSPVYENFHFLSSFTLIERTALLLLFHTFLPNFPYLVQAEWKSQTDTHCLNLSSLSFLRLLTETSLNLAPKMNRPPSDFPFQQLISFRDFSLGQGERYIFQLSRRFVCVKISASAATRAGAKIKSYFLARGFHD